MLDLQHLASSTKADVQVFVGTSTDWRTWQKPRGVSMIYMLVLGCGGNGGSGAVGAASTAAGGGGGGSGGQATLLIPAIFLPDTLYCLVPFTRGSLADTMVAVDRLSTNGTLLTCGYANNGGDGVGAAAGSAGVAAGARSTSNAPLSGMGRSNFLGGQGGIAGGVGGATNLSLPTTGLIVTGGTGGGGVGASGGGNLGGNITGSVVFPTLAGGIGPAVGATTTPPDSGSSGIQPIPGLAFFYGGTGGGSTHNAATGAGLVGANGGNGSYGCGGGGGGGALTGSTQGLGGRGGPGLVIIIAW
jgi:hypothetical protein